MVSQKCQYALRAVFELAKRHGRGPVRIGAVAKAQAIPPRFLEVILNQLKQAGFVESRRGNEGGYLLARAPERLTVGEIVRFVEGPIRPVTCTPDSTETACSLHATASSSRCGRRSARPFRTFMTIRRSRTWWTKRSG